MKKWLPYILLVGFLLTLAFHVTLTVLALKYVPSLQELALARLASLGEQAIPYVKDLLSGADQRLKKAAFQLLEAVGKNSDWSQEYPQLLQTVIGQFKSETDPVVRTQMAKVLGTSNTKEAVDALASGAKDPAIRGACVSALETIALKAPTPALQETARQMSSLAGSAEAATAVSTVVDVVDSVAQPALDPAGKLFSGLGLNRGGRTTATTSP